jgi:hypothetical protein
MRLKLFFKEQVGEELLAYVLLLAFAGIATAMIFLGIGKDSSTWRTRIDAERKITIRVASNAPLVPSMFGGPIEFNAGTGWSTLPSSKEVYLHAYDGDVLLLRATPNDGIAFDGWQNACEGSQTVCSVKVKGDQKVTANFIKRE